MNGFLIAAPQSGSGKTTVSLAVMAALTRRGLAVAPFKCGPDFIDPGYHRAMTGRQSINLDAWICPEEFVLDTFRHHSLSADVAVIEGAMGLFDGIGASSRSGSSAEIAAATGAPVVLVINARGMAASGAVLVNGFVGFDPQVKVVGVIFNNVGSDRHASLLKDAVALHCPGISCLGCIPRDDLLVIPSRHLGLVTADDYPLSGEFTARLAEMAERCLDLDSLCSLMIGLGEAVSPQKRSVGRTAESATVRIAVAKDEAFCFTYDDNLRLLREAGAELVFFSPMRDSSLPDDINGIYLPGGYPELHCDELAANVGMKDAIRGAVAANMPVYAECGGFVYLTGGLDGSENGKPYDFAGIFPVRCRMLHRRKALGYRRVELSAGLPIGNIGAVMRGHEFHYSEIGEMPAEIERCYHVTRQGVPLEPEGFRIHNCLGSYIHLHFGSNPDIAPAFVSACLDSH